MDIYFLQIQGSGKADLGGGDVVSVLYDGQNGRQYKSLGKQLIDKGAIAKENMSMPAIREYLRMHPEEVVPLLNQNPSYVFFRIDMGPSLGNISVPLTPKRSIATDSKLLPKGALAFIETRKPVIENGAIREWVPFTRFVLNQDTGGAIKGPGSGPVLGAGQRGGAGDRVHAAGREAVFSDPEEVEQGKTSSLQRAAGKLVLDTWI